MWQTAGPSEIKTGRPPCGGAWTEAGRAGEIQLGEVRGGGDTEGGRGRVVYGEGTPRKDTTAGGDILGRDLGTDAVGYHTHHRHAFTKKGSEGGG